MLLYCSFCGIKTIGLFLDQLTAHKPIELLYFSVIRSLRQQMIIEVLSNGCDVVNWKWSAVVVVVVGMMSICWSSTTARVWIKALLSASRRAPLRSSSQWRLKRRESLRACSTIWSRKTGLIAYPFPLQFKWLFFFKWNRMGVHWTVFHQHMSGMAHYIFRNL